MPFVWGVDWGDCWPRPGEPVTMDGSRLADLIAMAKRAELSTKEQIEIGCALELWHEMAVRCEHTIHQLTKDEWIDGMVKK